MGRKGFKHISQHGNTSGQEINQIPMREKKKPNKVLDEGRSEEQIHRWKKQSEKARGDKLV